LQDEERLKRYVEQLLADPHNRHACFLHCCAMRDGATEQLAALSAKSPGLLKRAHVLARSILRNEHDAEDAVGGALLTIAAFRQPPEDFEGVLLFTTRLRAI
jgi:hypothetical protein